MVPQSLYIHIPWCIKKCPYCDFNSHQRTNEIPEQEYIDALLFDLKSDIAKINDNTIQSIFIGGGTPSLFSAKSFEYLFSGLQKWLHFPPNVEITLEANPGTFEQKKFADYRALGINRLSLGIQSFNAAHLKKLGRIHDEKDAKLAIREAQKAGFDNINLDLMYGLSKQTLEEAMTDLNTALSFETSHLSWYQLTIEPNTVFYKTKPDLPKEDDIELIENEGYRRLNEHGFERYEISAFSQKNKACKHNLNYWLFGDYIGIGAGAHGKRTDLKNKTITRTQKHKQPAHYLNKASSFLVSEKETSAQDTLFEFMLNSSRLEQPIELKLFKERTFLDIEQILPYLSKAQALGLIELNSEHWQVTPLGRRFTNDLQLLFLVDPLT